MTTVVVMGTLDTKGPDIGFLAAQVRRAGATALVVDVGLGDPVGAAPDVTADEVAAAAGADRAALRAAGDRGAAVTAMGHGAAAVARRLLQEDRLDALLAAGGSGNSSIAAAAMAELPIGVPKLLVSTMASGDVSPYVGAKDVAILYSVVDVAGVNRVSRTILGNAAAAAVGMAAAHRERAGAAAAGDERPLVAASMFGVTTPAVVAAQEHLTGLGYEVLVFHATGAGGRALEALAEARMVAGVLDLTTTEMADDLVGGVLTAGPHRLEAAGRAGLPQVVAPGALDMVNFGPEATVPDRFAGRTLFVHNPTITLMRTTADEMAELGRRIAGKLAAATGPTEVFWPEGGVSALDAPDMPFADPAADAACLSALESGLAGSGVPVHRRPEHVNDPAFAVAMAQRLHEMITAATVEEER
ncbi:Tm-1-like ATP-binding domain-containing protein [Nakamurella endophytica]|uniref:Uncharacterized protein n=1 Tax=Nakamurella endophytica TaxID=1748367 RepID=A0A917SL32_9ACTN|nr:Tm-1-like ATP-binding domain-containing protein [Nakamurella endophytica]GGL86429.1 hypothetical protein GCM10011594_02560 [Nakamurella endophytica]